MPAGALDSTVDVRFPDGGYLDVTTVAADREYLDLPGWYSGSDEALDVRKSGRS